MKKNKQLQDTSFIVVDRAIFKKNNENKSDYITAALVILKSKLFFEDAYSFSIQDICEAIGRKNTSKNVLYVKGIIETLVNNSQEYVNDEWRFQDEEKNLSDVRLKDRIKILGTDKVYFKSFFKVYLEEFDKILKIPYKNKSYLFGIFCIIVSSIFVRKPGDSKNELPEACSLSMKQLEKYSGLSHATISIVLKLLEQYGLISIIRYTSERVHKGVKSIVHHTNVYCRGTESKEAQKRLFLMLKGQAYDDASKYLDESGGGDDYDEDASSWMNSDPDMICDDFNDMTNDMPEEFLEIADRERYEANETLRAATHDDNESNTLTNEQEEHDEYEYWPELY